MAHFPKPFFKQARKSWYVQIDRKQIKLGFDRDEAFRQYHQLMQQPAEQVAASPESLVNIIDSFLEWTERNRAPDTYEWYRYRLQRFVDKYPGMKVSSLKPFHVEEWVEIYDIAQTTRRNYFRSIKRCLSWAKRQGRIEMNPIEALDIPGAERREVYVPVDEFKTLLMYGQRSLSRSNKAVAQLIQWPKNDHDHGRKRLEMTLYGGCSSRNRSSYCSRSTILD